MTNKEVLAQINQLKSEVKETIRNIQLLKTQLDGSRISFSDFKLKKNQYEEYLRSLLKKIADLKESINFEATIQKAADSETRELKISKETEELMYYFKTEFEEFINKANVYLSGTVDEKYIELGFIELFYPPVAQKNKPFTVSCISVQRGAQKVNLSLNINHLSDMDPSRNLSDGGILIQLRPKKPEVSSFQIKAQDTHQYSFYGVLKEVDNKSISDYNDIYYDFEVKMLPFFETGAQSDFFQTKTGRYLIYSYLVCEKEEAEMFNELQDYLQELGVESFDPLLQIVPGAQNAENLLDLGRRIQETILFVIDHFKLIQIYQNFEKIETIERELLSVSQQLFKFTEEGIILEPLEGIENCLHLSMIFRLFFKICKLGLRKLLILKTILGIGKDYGYDISKYFMYIKKKPLS